MKIGMVGGIGPESTVDYYQRIIKLCREKSGDYPEIIIDSINMTAMLDHISKKDFGGIAVMLIHSIEMLYKAGAGFAFIASNTPHIVFEEVKKSSPVPLVSIVEAARSEAERKSIKKAGLLGTLFTMRSGLYKREFSKSGIEVAVPSEKEQHYIEEKLFSQIEHGIFLKETHDELLLIIERLVKDEAVDGVILGCTELPLILTEDAHCVPLLNTVKVHAEEVVKKYFELSAT